jgi:hypothetical protein
MAFVMLDAQHGLFFAGLGAGLDLHLDAGLVAAGLAFLLPAGDRQHRLAGLAIDEIGDLRGLGRPQRLGARRRREAGHCYGKNDANPHGPDHTRSTKVSTTFFCPALSKSTVSLLPSICATRP